MSRPVIADKWAGNYDCGICRRKRLVGSEFSKKALDKYRKSNGTHSLKCKKCVAEQETRERELAASRRRSDNDNGQKHDGRGANGNDNGDGNDVRVTCASYKKNYRHRCSIGTDYRRAVGKLGVGRSLKSPSHTKRNGRMRAGRKKLQR